MKTGRFIIFLSLLLLLLISGLTGPGCANIIPPQGGPRDSIPPVLISVTPRDSAKNFTGNKITLTFDEFIDIQNLQENLLVSPLPKITPVVDFKLKTVTVKLRDTLEANTTYSINFGNSIKDYNEGNPVKDLTYIFSTGRYIDSSTLSGTVKMAETGKVDSTLIVMLHTNSSDSALVKDKPRYIARLDGRGNFSFRNLPQRTYYLYALKDESGTHRYFSDKQVFAFAAKPVKIDSGNAPITLYAFSAKPASASAMMNPGITIGQRKKGGGETADKRLKYQTNLIENQQDLLSDFIMSFDQPLRRVDTARVKLYTDSTFTPVSVYSFKPDSTRTRLKLSLTWKENTLYRLVLDKDFADDSLGKKLLKSDTISFKTRKQAEYGSLKLLFTGLDISKNPVLQFIADEVLYKSYPLKSAEFSRDLFLPREYELRILLDENKNGYWDPGDFFGKHRQPEIVLPLERKISVKPGFRNEFDLKAPLITQ